MPIVIVSANLAMNTIPSIFNESPIKYTMLQGFCALKEGSLANPPKSVAPKLNLTVIVLNVTPDDKILPITPSHLRTQTIENLLVADYASIIWVVPNGSNAHNVEDLSKKFPTVKFVIPQEDCTIGVLINTAVSLVTTSHFMVLKDIVHVSQNILSPNVANNFMKQDIFCIAPRLLDTNGDGVIINNFPESSKGRFRISSASFVCDGLPVIYPVDFIGLYNRQKFIQLGGYDPNIKNSYWQNADLGTRAWLWGEQIRVTTQVTLSYDRNKEIDDVTRDYSYLYYYLKNVLPIFRDDHGVVRKSSFLNYKLATHCGWFEAKDLFNESKRWVALNQYRFKCDIRGLVESWGKKEQSVS